MCKMYGVSDAGKCYRDKCQGWGRAMLRGLIREGLTEDPKEVTEPAM